MHEFDEYLQRVRRNLNVSRQRADEICDEVRSHLEVAAVELQKSGLDRQDALQLAPQRFGDPEALGKRLTQANHVHRRQIVLCSGLLGLVIGSLVFYLALVVLILIHFTSSYSITTYSYFVVFTGGLPGAICGMLIARWRIRTATIITALAVIGAFLMLIWTYILYASGSFNHATFSIWRMAEYTLPIVPIYAAITLATSLGVHRWIMNRTPSAQKQDPQIPA